MGTYSLYIHTNKVNGKRYIGITCAINPSKRWGNGKGYNNQARFWRAIQKYGWDNFHHEIRLSGLTFEEACSREQYYIKLFRTTDDNYGYNMSIGGKCGADQGKDCYSREAKRRYNKKYMESHPDKRKVWSDFPLEERIKWTKKWRDNNPTKNKDSHKKYEDANREKINAHHSEYGKATGWAAQRKWREKHKAEKAQKEAGV